MGLAGIRGQALEFGFGRQLRGRSAMIVGTILFLAGLVAITPFLWGVARLLLPS